MENVNDKEQPLEVKSDVIIPEDEDDNTKLPDLTPEEDKALEKISKLVENAANMQKIAEEKTRATELYFNNLRERLNNSTVFLNKIKSDIENIKFNYHNDMKNMDYGDFDKTEDEIDEEMKDIKRKLEELHNSVSSVKSAIRETDSFETTMTKTVDMLNMASKGVFNEENQE